MKRLLTLSALILLSGCFNDDTGSGQPTPMPETTCPGFEVTNTGSGCRNTATGKFVDAAKCKPPCVGSEVDQPPEQP